MRQETPRSDAFRPPYTPQDCPSASPSTGSGRAASTTPPSVAARRFAAPSATHGLPALLDTPRVAKHAPGTSGRPYLTALEEAGVAESGRSVEQGGAARGTAGGSHAGLSLPSPARRTPGHVRTARRPRRLTRHADRYSVQLSSSRRLSSSRPLLTRGTAPARKQRGQRILRSRHICLEDDIVNTTQRASNEIIERTKNLCRAESIHRYRLSDFRV
jgi:hypothetical protein